MKVIVYSAPWCGPCKMLKPALKKAGIEFTNIDVDADLKGASAAKVKGVPTTIIQDENGKELERLVGFTPRLINKIQNIIGGNE